MNRIPELDGLRGLAITMVLGFHYGWGFFQPEPGTVFAYLLIPVRVLWVGVDLFFVLSGFLITSILLATRLEPNYFRAFFGRRITRIFPLYFCMFLLFIAGITLQRSGLIYMPRLFEAVSGYAYYAFFMQNFYLALHGASINFLSVSWSLALEEQMYLMLPILVYSFRQRVAKLVPVLSIVILLAILFREGLNWAYPEQAELANYVLPMARMDAFALGALVAVAAYHNWPGSKQYWQAMGWVLLTLGVAGVAQLALSNPFGQQKYLLIIMLFTGLLVLSLQQSERAPIRRILRARPLRWIGSISFGVYLLHIPILGLCMVVFGLPEQDLVSDKPKIVTLLALVLTLSLAQLSYSNFEAPIISWGRRQFSYRKCAPLDFTAQADNNPKNKEPS